jgi:hypothetical protein
MIRRDRTSFKKRILLAVTALLLGFLLPLCLTVRPAYAICTRCSNERDEGEDTRVLDADEHYETALWIDQEWRDWEAWIAHWLMPRFPPIWSKMTEEMSVAAMQQAFIIGTYFDSRHQIQVQRAFQKKSVEAHKDYQPSMGICAMGTAVRSLAASEESTTVHRNVLNKWAMDRQLGNINSNAAEGEHVDRNDRLEEFRQKFCDINDNNGGFTALCTASGPPGFQNKDIDYGGAVDRPNTLYVDLSDTTMSPAPPEDEASVMALASNLYGHQVMPRIPETMFNTYEHRYKVLEQHALIAKRNVAEASFFTIVGLKAASRSPGLAGSTLYMDALLRELGVQPKDWDNFLGIGTNPSYDAQMELLTKRLYQNPVFYTNLEESPANIDRKKVALQAVDLMQSFDMLESYLRTEMMMSLLLELEVIKLQEKVQNNINALGTEEG